MQNFSGDGGATWKIYTPSVPKGKQVAIVWKSFATPVALDATPFGYGGDGQFVGDADSKSAPLMTLPQTYHLVNRPKQKPAWVEVAARDVPAETGLAGYHFDPPHEDRPEPYTTPTRRAAGRSPARPRARSGLGWGTAASSRTTGIGLPTSPRY